jgi:hypothetical protein
MLAIGAEVLCGMLSVWQDVNPIRIKVDRMAIKVFMAFNI